LLFCDKGLACYYGSMFFTFLFAKVFRKKYLQLIIIGLDSAGEQK
jgi:hypothetical protein